MKNTVILFLMFISFSLSAQENRREMIDGEEYIIHTVKKGETLYGISKKHNVSKKELRGNNAGMLLFIKVGQEIRVPISNDQKTMHKVKKGETLYGISKKYGVSIDELVKLNPKKSSNVKEGDILTLRTTNQKATAELKVNEINSTTSDKVIKHTVKKGETLYGIARQYKTSVAEIKALNPGMGDGIKVGDVIKVPSITHVSERKKPVETAKPVKTSKQIEYTVKKGETLYGISKKYNTTVGEIKQLNPSITSLKEGDKIKINLPENYNEEIKVVLGDPKAPNNSNFNEINKINPLKDQLNEMVKKDSYTVSMFLPFMLDKNERIPQEINKPTKINPYTEMSVHFYQGVMLALDSVKKSGVSINLSIYDTENDTATVGKHLRTSEVKESDLIIGPFFERPYTQVAKFSKANKIQAVCPVSQSNKLLFNNKYVTELQTSLPTQIAYLSTYLSSNKNTENVICVSGKTKKDKYLASMFSEQYNKKIKGKSNNYRSKASAYNMTSFSSMRGFDAKLVKGKKNIIVIPFTEEGMATAFFTQLNVMMSRSRMRGYEVEVYALENFMEYDGIHVELKLKYHLHITSSSFIDYKDEKVIKFIKNYRKEFGTEPSKYAFVGFDVAFYHAIAMSNFGKNYTSYYGSVKVPLLQSSYVLERTDNVSGFENQSVYILAYQDYELVKIN